MGLFGLGKKNKSVVSHSKDPNVKFLTIVDDEYVRAFQTKVLGNLDKYLTRLCCTKLMERIRMSEKENVGMSRYRKTEWQRSSDGTYIKSVSYEDVNMGCGIKVPLGDPYTELWTIVNDDSTKKVSEIRRQSC